MVPDGMTSEVHEFEPREGGRFRISLTYADPGRDAPGGQGEPGARTDTFHGRFVRLVPGAEVVQAVEFETADPGLRGEMTVTWALADDPDGQGTELAGTHENLPPGVSPAGNELGWNMSAGELARLVEDR